MVIKSSEYVISCVKKEQYPNNNFMFMTVGERITI